MLRSVDVLDTAPEERFDRVTCMVVRLFDVKIALVSIVDLATIAEHELATIDELTDIPNRRGFTALSKKALI